MLYVISVRASWQRYLDKLGILVLKLAVGKFVSLNNPRMLQDLLGCEPLVRVHMEHLRDQVLHGKACV